MFYKAKIGMVMTITLLGALTVAQWTIVACLLFGIAITIALHYQWLIDNPQWVVIGTVLVLIFGLGLVGGHDVWVKRVIAVLVLPLLAYFVRQLQKQPRPDTAILIEAHRKQPRIPTRH